MALGPSGLRPQNALWPTATIRTLGHKSYLIMAQGHTQELFANTTILYVAGSHAIVIELKPYIFHQWLQATL